MSNGNPPRSDGGTAHEERGWGDGSDPDDRGPSIVDRLRSFAWAVTDGHVGRPAGANPEALQEHLYPLEETNEAIKDHPVRHAVLADVKAAFETELDYEFVAPVEERDIERLFFDFDYLEGREEVERYWVNEPFAYVSILEDPAEHEQHYHVSEPTLTMFEQYMREELTKILRNSLMYENIEADADKEAIFSEEAAALIDEHTAALRPISIHKILYYLKRDFLDYDKIDPIVRDVDIEDISCDGVDVPVFVYHGEYRDLDTNVVFDNEDLASFVMRLAQRAGKHLSVSNPLVDASLPNGSRIQLTFGGDVATRGPNFTIRQFSSLPDTPIDLVNWGTFTVEQMAYFWLAIENNRSLVFAGGTGSGKTTSLNAVSFFIPKKSKLVTIEDTREIQLPHDNWIQSMTRESVTSGGQGEVTMYQQLQSALRQRPEYILVGEIRTEPRVALTFFQAMATGHTAYTTVHSESVTGVINRLENEPLNVPTQMIKELDIISIQRQVMLGDERVRRNDRVTELVSGGDTQDIHVNDVFRWNASADSYNSQFDSTVFDDIAADRGWNRKRLTREYERRKEVLQYLIDEDVTWYIDVAKVIHGFMNDQEYILDRIRADDLEPAEVVPDEPAAAEALAEEPAAGASDGGVEPAADE